MLTSSLRRRSGGEEGTKYAGASKSQKKQEEKEKNPL